MKSSTKLQISQKSSTFGWHKQFIYFINIIDAGQFSIGPVLEKKSYIMILTSDGSKLGGIGKLIRRPTISCFMKFFQFPRLLGQNVLQRGVYKAGQKLVFQTGFGMRRQ
jgi:hypothetical protein